MCGAFCMHFAGTVISLFPRLLTSVTTSWAFIGLKNRPYRMNWQRDGNTCLCNKPISGGESCARAAVSRQQGLYSSPRGIQKIAEQAFWDVLAEGLDQKPPQWTRLLTLLEEARTMLLELIPENAQEGTH